MRTEMMDPELELSFLGVSGNWTIHGKTETICCFTLGVTGHLLFAPSLNTRP